MADYGCNRIVYSSSATVYGTPPIIPIPETTRLQADSPYGKTKVMAETIINDLCHGKAFLRIPMEFFSLIPVASGQNMASHIFAILQVSYYAFPSDSRLISNEALLGPTLPA